MVRLIADAGGTKTDWCFIPSAGRDVELFTTSGINPSVMTDGQLISAVEELCLSLKKNEINDLRGGVLNFFGAGCNSVATKKRLNLTFAILRSMGLEKMIFESDLVGASKALFGRSSGITCILGTGSASCLYDGQSVIDSVPSLGYVFGDEGSGAFMGKLLLNVYFKGELPKEICTFLEDFANVEMSHVIKMVYRSEGANSYLASFVPFLKKYEHLEEISILIDQSLKLFFKKNVFKYKDYLNWEVGFAGGIADAFASRIEAIALGYGMKIAGFTSRPVEGLCRYFLKETENYEL